MPVDPAAFPPKRKGGVRPGAGQKRKFSPNNEMRGLVKMLLALSDCTYDEICECLMNPITMQPISRDTFERAFKREIKVAKTEMKAIASAAFVKGLKSGNLGHFAMFAKNKMGWSDNPAADKTNKPDPSGGTIKHEVEIIGGLPSGSSPDKPEGDDYSEIPPEESHG